MLPAMGIPRSSANRTAQMMACARKLSMSRPPSEGHDLVAHVVADIGASEIGDAETPAPAAHDRLLVLAEIGIVGQDIAHAAEADAAKAPHMPVRQDVEYGAIDAIEMLGHVLEHQHVAGKIGLHRGAAPVAQTGD